MSTRTHRKAKHHPRKSVSSSSSSHCPKTECVGLAHIPSSLEPRTQPQRSQQSRNDRDSSRRCIRLSKCLLHRFHNFLMATTLASPFRFILITDQPKWSYELLRDGTSRNRVLRPRRLPRCCSAASKSLEASKRGPHATSNPSTRKAKR